MVQQNLSFVKIHFDFETIHTFIVNYCTFHILKHILVSDQIIGPQFGLHTPHWTDYSPLPMTTWLVNKNTHLILQKIKEATNVSFGVRIFFSLNG